MPDALTLIRQTILDEAQGNLSIAFDMACHRLAHEYTHADQLEAEVAQWRKGASLAYLRMKAEPRAGKIDDVPSDACHDDWIATGKEITEAPSS